MQQVPPNQGCQMAYFQAKNPNLGKFWRILQWKLLVYFTDIWYILWTFGIFYGHLVYFMDIWYILSTFGIFFPFWYFLPRKIWQPCTKQQLGLVNGVR
jgi:hypothetical protein